MKKIIGLIAIIVLTYFIYAQGSEILRPKIWSLFIYSTFSPDMNHLINRIDGYNQQTECLESGIKLIPKNGSYECGYDCRYQEGLGINDGLEVCKKTCSKTGCQD